MNYPLLDLNVLNGRFAICKLPPDAAIPAHLLVKRLVSTTRTESELTVVCEETEVFKADAKESGWRCIKVNQSFNLEAVGVLAAIAAPLAKLGISIYVVSTFDTDMILIKEERHRDAIDCLSRIGHRIRSEDAEK